MRMALADAECYAARDSRAIRPAGSRFSRLLGPGTTFPAVISTRVAAVRTSSSGRARAGARQGCWGWRAQRCLRDVPAAEAPESGRRSSDRKGPGDNDQRPLRLSDRGSLRRALERSRAASCLPRPARTPLLQHAQQLGLEFQGDLADFIAGEDADDAAAKPQRVTLAHAARRAAARRYRGTRSRTSGLGIHPAQQAAPLRRIYAHQFVYVIAFRVLVAYY